MQRDIYFLGKDTNLAGHLDVWRCISFNARKHWILRRHKVPAHFVNEDEGRAAIIEEIGRLWQVLET